MTGLVEIKFKPMDKEKIEFKLDPNFKPESQQRFVVISPEDAFKTYFANDSKKTNVYVVNGGQKGDEGKGVTTEIIRKADPNIKWTEATSSTHNAGKGVHTFNEDGEPVRFSLHLCPATLVDSDVKNYIGSNTQVNLFTLETEVRRLYEETGRTKLGENYHLMLDSLVNLVIPTNRADDVVGKKNAMGSTIVGASASFGNAAWKKAPFVEDVLYEPEKFKKIVNTQIQEFNDRLSHDEELAELGITDIRTLGEALQNQEVYQKNKRLTALAAKLSDKEIAFFSNEKPAEYLLNEFQMILRDNLFYIGNCRDEINNHLRKGEAGILEGVQSVLLSGSVKYGPNKTAAGTHSAQTIADACLDPALANYIRTLSFKYANTSVGGNKKTMSGFIRQDALFELEAPLNGERVSFEKTATLDLFLSKEEIIEAFYQITDAFYEAIENGYSIHNSTVRVKGIDVDMPLAQARALFTSYKWGERGETSKRARICRFDDLVESGIVDSVEGNAMQVRNAVDRALDLKKTGIALAYEVVKPYGGYKVGDIIKPGMSLRQEHLTTESCIPVIALLPSWDSLNADGTNELKPGAELHPDLCKYLSVVADGRTVIAIGAGPKTKDKHYIKAIN